MFASKKGRHFYVCPFVFWGAESRHKFELSTVENYTLSMSFSNLTIGSASFGILIKLFDILHTH